MTIAVNARFLGQEVSGVQRYGGEVLRELPDATDSPVTLWGGSGGRLGARLGEIIGPRRRQDKVLLNLCNWGPVLNQTRSVVVVHDLLPIEQPWSYSSMYRLAVRAQLEAFKRGNAEVVTVSERSRRRLVEALGRHVEIAPCGVRRPAPQDIGESGVDDGFALFVGAHDPRKSVGFALGLLPALRKFGLRLVITMRAGSAVHSSGRSSIRAGLDDPSVMVIDGPSDRRLWALYRDASLLLHPSVAEGFGLPLLEAAVMGTPSVSTPVGAAEEILGEPALVVPAVEGLWSDAISYCLKYRSRLQSDLRTRAAAYTWRNTAASIAAVCARVGERQ